MIDGWQRRISRQSLGAVRSSQNTLEAGAIRDQGGCGLDGPWTRMPRRSKPGASVPFSTKVHTTTR